jgi:hypothetical protein
MNIQDYLNGYKVAYDEFVKRASTHGEVNEDSFSMYGRVDYGDIAFSIKIKSSEGFKLEYTCPITSKFKLDTDEESLWNRTLGIHWGESLNINRCEFDAFKALDEYLNHCSHGRSYFNDGSQWVISYVESHNYDGYFALRYLPEPFKNTEDGTWEDVNGIKHKEEDGVHYFIVNGENYSVSTETYKIGE